MTDIVINDDVRRDFIARHSNLVLTEISNRARDLKESVLDMAMNHPDRMTKVVAYKNSGQLKAYDEMLDFIDAEIRKEQSK